MRRLPRISSPGVFTVSAWARICDIIERNFQEVTLQRGPGYNLTVGPGGTTLRIRPASQSVQVSAQLPFEVVTQTVTVGGVAVTQWGVINNSPIYSDIGPNDDWNYLPGDGTQGGFLSAGYTSTDGAWLNMAAPPSPATTATPYDCLYLQVAYNTDGSVNTSGTGAAATALCSWGTGTRLFDPTLPAWQTGAYMEHDGATPPNFTVFRKPVAYATGSGQIVQMITQQQMIVPVIQAGLGGWYALPTDTGYPF